MINREPQTLYNLKDEEVEFDPLALSHAHYQIDNQELAHELSRMVTDLDHDFTNDELGRILAGFFLIAKLKGDSIPANPSPGILMRAALAALDTAIIWERG